MGDWLQTSANIIQIVGGLWILFLGGKTVSDFTKRIKLKQSFHVSLSSSSITNILSIIILVLLIGTYFRTSLISATSQNSPSQGPSAHQSFTPAPPTVPSPIAPTPAASGPRSVNDKLFCKQCDPNFQLSLTSCIVSSDRDEVIFSFTAKNNTESDIELDNGTFTLQSFADEKPHQSRLGGDDAPIDDLAYIHMGGEVQISSVFNFTPDRGIPYTGLVNIEDHNGQISPMVFEPLTLTF